MRHNLIWLCILPAMLTTAGGALAQDNATPMAVSSEVQKLIAKQDWAKAERKLADGQARCGSDQQGKSCRLLLNYSQGVLLQTQSAHDRSQRQSLLKSSADAYRRVLSEDPGHAPTTYNLALVLADLGDTTELQQLYRVNAKTSPQLAASISLVLGDVYDAGGEWDQAYAAYEKAADLAPLDDVAKLRMVASFGDVSGGSDQFLGRLQGWEYQAPDIAAQGYAAIVRKEAAAPSTTASEALVRWVSQAAAARQISPERVTREFGKLDAQSIRELFDFLERLREPSNDPQQSPGDLQSFLHSSPRVVDDLPWWRETRERKHALAEAALATGRATAAEGNAIQAQYQFLSGLQTAPEMMEYLSSPPPGANLVPLELITELAWLQYRNPDVLDPGHEKLPEVIDLIIESKGMAYEANDSRAIQRHHTLLGEIFVAEGAWTGGRYGFDTAIFQLPAAIAAAARREKAEGFYQPLANVKAQLAAGYRAERREGDEATTRIAAYLAALDSDDFKLAETQLVALGEIADGKRRDQLAVLLQARSEAFEARVGRKKPDPSTQKLPRWAAAKTMADVDEATLRRQQFKLLADLAVGAVLRKDRDLSRKHAQTALRAARAVSTLIGTEDVLRVERISIILTGGAISANQPPLMIVTPSDRRPDRLRGEWFLVLPSSDLPFIASLPSGQLADLVNPRE